MASPIAEWLVTVRSTPTEEFAWWKYHVAFFVSVFVAFPAVLLSSPDGILGGLWRFFGVAGAVRSVLNVTLWVLGVVLAVSWIGALFGYYYDAKYIDTLEVDYSPHWKAYVLLHLTFVVGAFLAVPIYTIQRLRHVGIPLFAKERL